MSVVVFSTPVFYCCTDFGEKIFLYFYFEQSVFNFSQILDNPVKTTWSVQNLWKMKDETVSCSVISGDAE